MKLILTIIFGIFLCKASATTYYLSAYGNDGYSGLSKKQAWRTLNHLSKIKIASGDSILLERGSTFIGTLVIGNFGSSINHVYVGAYGTGNKPVISGAEEIKNWSRYSGNIWVADWPESFSEPSDIFFDGKIQKLGRYPNQGYKFLTNSPTTQLEATDSASHFTNGFWNNAELVVRSKRWILDNIPIQKYSNQTFYFKSAGSYPIPAGCGYFIQNHLATLDEPGEWFFDSGTKKIYLFLPSQIHPHEHALLASVYETGIDIQNSNFSTVENISIKYFKRTGARIEGCEKIIFNSCDIAFSSKNGIEVITCKAPLFENNLITDSNNNGINWINNIDGTFSDNIIKRTGLRAGRGNSGDGSYISISITSYSDQSGEDLFQYNTIDSIGYIGVDFRKGNIQIRNNIISHFCLVKDDGAGIYTWGNKLGNNLIEGNIISYGIGSGEGTANPSQHFASGIYMDDQTSDVDIKRNTVAHCATAGILIHNSTKITISENILFGNGNSLLTKERGQLYIKRDALVSMSFKNLNLRVTQNHLIATQATSSCVYISAESKHDIDSLGKFTQNYYSSENPSRAAVRFYNHQDLCDAEEEIGLSSWQKSSGLDSGSLFKLIYLQPYKFTENNLVHNGEVTNDSDGWIAWPLQSSLTYDKIHLINGPSLNVTIAAGQSEAMLYNNGITMNTGKLYRLSFSAMSKKNESKIEVVMLKETSPWNAVSNYACFTMSTSPQSYVYLFQSQKNDKARVNFKSTDTFWIDNVVLQEMTTDFNQAKESVKLISNSTKNQITISLKERYFDIDGKSVSNNVTLQPFISKVLFVGKKAKIKEQMNK